MMSGPREIVLADGQTVTVDADDYEYLCQYNWFAQSGVTGQSGRYPATKLRRNKTATSMVSFIMEAPEGMIVDHVDGKPLNAQKYNLRICTQQQNTWNSRKKNRDKATSAYKGVSWSKGSNKWVAQIKVNGGPKCLGYFPLDQEKEAARAYDAAARDAFGEFACLNFPEHADRQVLVNVGQ